MLAWLLLLALQDPPKQTPEVVVIGEKENLDHVPGSGHIIDEKMFEETRPTDVHQILRRIPGLHTRDEDGLALRPNIGIRGLFPTRSSKVLLLEDGIPFTLAPYGDTASYFHPPVDRFQRIEVLKGSGQILFGPQTIGGVINYITRNPPEDFGGRLSLVGGTREYLKGHLSIGGTEGDVAVLLDYNYLQGSGSRENIFSRRHDVTLKTIFDLGPDTSLMVKLNNYDELSQTTYAGLTEAAYSADPRQNPFDDDEMDFERFGGHGLLQHFFDPKIALRVSLYGHAIERRWWRQWHNGVATNVIPATMGTTLPNNRASGRLREYYVYGVEPRVEVAHDLGNLQFGARAHFETQLRRQKDSPLALGNDGARFGVLSEKNLREAKAYSGFVQNRFEFGDWSVTPGVRVEQVNYHRKNRLTGASGSDDLLEVIPGLGVTYAPCDDVTLFVGAHRGFAPPRTEDAISAAGVPVGLDAELSWNYELGCRATALDGDALSVDGTLFMMDFENQIIPASVAGGTGATLTNAGSTLHEGLELAGKLDIAKLCGEPYGFSVDVAYTWLWTAEFSGTRLSSVTGSQLMPGEPAAVSVRGNRLPYAPEHLITGGLGWSHECGLDLRLETVYVARQYTDDRNRHAAVPSGRRGVIDDYTILNFTANFRPFDDEDLTFFLSTKNLADSDYIVDRSRGILPGMPRQILFGIEWGF